MVTLVSFDEASKLLLVGTNTG